MKDEYIQPMRSYGFINEFVTAAKKITVDRLCNGIMIVNTGTSIMFVNDAAYYPNSSPPGNGDAFTIGGNFGEILDERIQIRFSAGGTNSCTVTQKIYRR